MQSSGGNIVSYGKAHKRGQLKEAVLFSCISSPTEASSKGAALPVRRTLLAWIAWMAFYTPTAPLGPASLRETHSPGPAPSPHALLFPILWKQRGNKNDTPGLQASAPSQAFLKPCSQASRAGSVYFGEGGKPPKAENDSGIILLSAYLYSEREAVALRRA